MSKANKDIQGKDKDLDYLSLTLFNMVLEIQGNCNKIQKKRKKVCF